MPIYPSMQSIYTMGIEEDTTYERLVFSLNNRKQTRSRWLNTQEGTPSNLRGEYILGNGLLNNVLIISRTIFSGKFYVYKNYNSSSSLLPGQVPVCIIELDNEKSGIYNVGIPCNLGDQFKVYMEIEEGNTEMVSCIFSVKYV